MSAIELEYSGPPLGPVRIKAGGGAPQVDVNVTGQPQVAVDLSTPAGRPPFGVETIINGNPLNPIGAVLTTPAGEALAVDVRLGDLGLRPSRVRFRLFGLLTILTMEVGP